MADSRTDAKLLESLRDRDPRAFELLYDRFARRAFGLAYRILGDRGAAEDAMQEAFLAIWQHADRLDSRRGQIAPLMLAVVHHKASDQLRRRRDLNVVMPPDGLGLSTTRESDPGEVALRAVDRSILLGAIDSLPHEQQMAVQLAYFDGHSHSQIAQMTGARLGTVKSRLRIALVRLRDILSTGAQA